MSCPLYIGSGQGGVYTCSCANMYCRNSSSPDGCEKATEQSEDTSYGGGVAHHHRSSGAQQVSHSHIMYVICMYVIA